MGGRGDAGEPRQPSAQGSPPAAWTPREPQTAPHSACPLGWGRGRDGGGGSKETKRAPLDPGVSTAVRERRGASNGQTTGTARVREGRVVEGPHQSGKVLFLSRPMRFLLMVVEQGTASRWCELLGRVGTHWLFLLAFCSLGDTDTTLLSLRAKSRSPAARSWPVDACCAPAGPRPPRNLCAPSSAGGYSPGSQWHLLRVTRVRGGGEGTGPGPVCELSPRATCWAGLGTQ